MKQFKQLIGKVVQECEKGQGEGYERFLRDLLRWDVIESGLVTVKNMWEKGARLVKDYFNTEEKTIQELNPYLLTFLLKQYQRHCPARLLSRSSYLPALFNLHLHMALLLQDDKSGIKNNLYGSILRLLAFVEENMRECIGNGVLEKLLNNELFKEMT